MEAVAFLGVHKADIDRVFAEADLFTRTAEFETFRLVTLEASVAEPLVIVRDRIAMRLSSNVRPSTATSIKECLGKGSSDCSGMMEDSRRCLPRCMFVGCSRNPNR